jgi:DNA-binding NarL/FixJ family response regulator
MANHSVLIENENAAPAVEKTGLHAPPANISPRIIQKNKQPEMDDVLENTLLNFSIDNSLTKRENEILIMIVAGKTNKDISQKICRTERTVEYHRHRLMAKLGAKTAADLVKRSIVMGIV